MLSTPLRLRLFSALFLLSSLLGAIAAPVGDTTGQLEQRMPHPSRPKPIFSEMRLIRKNSKTQQIMTANDTVQLDEMWSLQIGKAEFRAVRSCNSDLKWQGLPVCPLSRARGIRLGGARFSTAEDWKEVETNLRKIEADSNLMYIDKILLHLTQQEKIGESDLYVWKGWEKDPINNTTKPEGAVELPTEESLLHGLVGFYWRMLDVGGDAGGDKKNTPIQCNK
ncbi:hypothetical protein C8J55DRAFT_88655 [Lentinula edodes]|uniref:Uncharacterized protein n=1 Tax=Lentinula lateritia TaxID=40482 RepID=A0A9W9DMG4_9AGAR|nr:hypothetical protein C8J55DRAFT_88655 [Lentinula edodes]